MPVPPVQLSLFSLDSFTTVYDNQTSVTISVYEGEQPKVQDNHFLDKFELSGIPPAPRYVPQIEVTFEIDASGILHVSAFEAKGGKRGRIQIRIKRE
jgi:molecular chaperone DnaK (HSP70)